MWLPSGGERPGRRPFPPRRLTRRSIFDNLHRQERKLTASRPLAGGVEVIRGRMADALARGGDEGRDKLR